MKTPDKEETIRYFGDLLLKHGDSYRTLDWNSEYSQRLRYSVFLDIYSFTNKLENVSVLDVGCGLGHFYGFLKEEGLLDKYKIEYTGIDISQELISFAREKYPKASFEVSDIAEREIKKRFDYVFSSGVFNLRFSPNADQTVFAKETLPYLYYLSKIGVGVNFLSTTLLQSQDVVDEKYYFHNPDSILNLVKTIAKRHVLRSDYYDGDFTVYMFKGDF